MRRTRAVPPAAAALMLVGLLACPPTARAWISPVPDVVVYSTPALAPALALVAARYTASRGVKVHLFVGSSGGQTGLITRRARADVIVADAATIAAMAGHQLLKPGPPAPVGLDGFVLIARGADGIAAGSPASLDRGHVFVVTDPTSAASFDGQAVLRQAVATPVSPPIGVANTPDVVFTVLHGHGLVGLVQASESRLPAIATVGALPVAPMLIQAALVGGGQSGRAPDFIAFLAGPEGQRIMREQGLDPAP